MMQLNLIVIRQHAKFIIFFFKRLVLKTKIIIKTQMCGLLLVTSKDNMSYINHTILKLITITGASKGFSICNVELIRL